MPRLPNEQRMWIAYLGEVRQVKIVEKGHGGVVFKRGEKPKDPYVVYDEIDQEEFVMGSADLYHNPRDAQIAAQRLAKQEGFLDGTEYQGNPTVVRPPEPDEDEGAPDEEEPEDEEEGCPLCGGPLEDNYCEACDEALRDDEEYNEDE